MFTMYYMLYPKFDGETVLLFVRFIDDILCITTSEQHSKTLLALLNAMHPTIRFTDSLSCKAHTLSETRQSVDFLDITLYTGALFHGAFPRFDMVTFQKPMNAYLYIPLYSHHHPAVFKSFVQSEIRRYTLNSTCSMAVECMVLKLGERLRARGYPHAYVQNITSVRFVREDILFPPHVKAVYSNKHHQYHPRSATTHPFNPPFIPSTKLCNESPIVFKILYTPTYAHKDLTNLLKYTSGEHSLRSDHMLCIPRDTHHPTICYKRTQSIGDLLITSKQAFIFPW